MWTEGNEKEERRRKKHAKLVEARAELQGRGDHPTLGQSLCLLSPLQRRALDWEVADKSRPTPWLTFSANFENSWPVLDCGDGKNIALYCSL